MSTSTPSSSSRSSKLIPPSKHIRAQSGSKPAGNSPLPSPAKDRKPLHLGDNSLILDVTSVSPKKVESGDKPPETESTPESSCPCKSTTQRGQAPTICCTVCKKRWHTGCCNLLGTTPTVTKTLEVQGWKCPLVLYTNNP